MAAFEASEPLKGLDCAFEIQKPTLGLDLRFHTGYQVTFVKESSPEDDQVTIVLKIADKSRPDRPVYMQDRLRAPPVDGPEKVAARIPGKFALGAGAYRVDMLLHDRADHYCSSSWDLNASLSSKYKGVPLSLAEGAVAPLAEDLFLPESRAHKTEDAPLNVKILANFAPREKSSAALDPRDTEATTTILRDISRNPRVGTISILAFDLYEERVVFRQSRKEGIDFPALGAALKSLQPGTVARNQLLDKQSSATFLAALLHDEEANEPKPDALIFVGPKAFVESSPEEFKAQRNLGYPVYYFNYIDDPQAAPWRDNIGNVTKWLGGRVFSITGPSDLWNALTELVRK
ncbi:MAG TPA: acetyltransferase [Bryobacteraceae bacterium]